MAAGATLLGTACDQGEPELQSGAGPDLRVVATFPSDGDGTDCPGGNASCGIPRDTTIELRFDRYIRPTDAVRQSIRLFTGSTDNSQFLEPTYDVVERVVVYELTRTLAPDTLYTVEIKIPTEDSPNGFHAFDGAPLTADGSAPLRFNFRTREEEPPPPSGRPPAPTCGEILDVFRDSCARCHSSPLESPGPEETDAGCGAGERYDQAVGCVKVPRQGLRLGSRDGLVHTAIGKVAHQTEIGPSGGTPLANPDRLGVQMPIVDPGKPGNSYLMYKLLRNRNNLGPCTTDYNVDLAGQCAFDEDEAERLREWFVRLDPMPADGFSIPRQDLNDIQAWIRALDTPSSPAQCQ